MNYLDYIEVFVATIAAGAINSVAGGGMFLIFPLLIFYGFTPLQANVTSTIALWPGSIASATAYRKEWMAQKEILPALLLMSVSGSAIGAALLMLLPEATFEWLVPWLLLAATLLFLFGRRLVAWVHVRFPEHPGNKRQRYVMARAFQFIISIYGGYFGAGAGILMLAMLEIMGITHIHRMNAFKTVFGAAINGVAVVIFIAVSPVIWPVGLVMLAGAVIGGYFGAFFAQKLPPGPVRHLVGLYGVVMTAYFFMKN